MSMRLPRRGEPVSGSTSSSARDAASGVEGRVAWIDALRVLGATLIFLYHFGADYQIIVGPASAAGLSSWLTITADPDLAVWAVSLFVILSGLSLTLAGHGSASYRPRYAQRAVRLLAPLWVIAVPYISAGLILGEMSTEELWKVPIWLLGLGVVSPATFFPVSKAWWYVTLALQCALVMPLIVALVRRLGLTKAMALLIATELATLWLIALLPPAWQYLRMGLVLARLIELSVGVLAAEALSRHVGWARALFLAIMLVAAGSVARMLGAVTGAQIVGVWAGVAVVLAVLAGRGRPGPGWLTAAAVATYMFYLVHAPIGKYTITWLSAQGVHSYGILLATAASLAIAATYAATLGLRAASMVVRRALSGRGDSTTSKT